MILKLFLGVILFCFFIRKSLGCSDEVCDRFFDVEFVLFCNVCEFLYFCILFMFLLVCFCSMYVVVL